MNSLLLGGGQAIFGQSVASAVGAWTTALTRALIACGIDESVSENFARSVIERIQGALILCRVDQSRGPLDKTVDELKLALQQL